MNLQQVGPVTFFNETLGYVPDKQECIDQLIESGYELTDISHLDHSELLEALQLELTPDYSESKMWRQLGEQASSDDSLLEDVEHYFDNDPWRSYE